MLYFQGGGAARNSDVQLFNPAGTQVGEVSKTRTGWTIGVGSEYKFAPNWSVFLEYNYADFGTNGVSIIVPPTVRAPFRVTSKPTQILF